MNKMKKFASIATAVLMTACMAAPMTMSLTSSAAPVDYSMSLPSGIPSNSSIANLKAVKIFNATYDSTNNVLNITGWADSVTLATITAKLASESAVKTELSGITEAVDVAAKLAAWEADTTNNGHAKVEEFAKAAAEALKGSTGVTGTFDKDNKKASFDDLGTGYYVVLCDIQKNDSGYDATSLGMLTVTGAGGTAQIGLGEAKVGLPEVMKKVYENVKTSTDAAAIGGLTETDKKWNDVADYCIGDSVPFKLYGTMPQDIAKYDHYYYQFTDTLGKEFTAPTSVTINVNGKAITKPANSDIFTKITENADGSTTITVTFEDIKEVIKTVEDEVSATDIITVEYEAVLNTNAVIGLPGQENKVDLTYSNNPNVVYIPNGGSGDTTPGTPDEGETGTPETPDTPGTPGDNTGKTPEDKVIVFTYELDVTKKFFEANGTEITNTDALKSAVKFELRKDSESGTAITFLNNMPSKENGANKDLVLDTNNQIILKGLDDGTYYLVETSAPTGFNKANPMKIVITAGTVNNQTWSGTSASTALESFSYTVGEGANAKTVYQGKDGDGNKIETDDETAGKYANIDSKAKADVENKKGSTLPGTGGIGTTLFYVGGGAMVAVAGVFLITKKRMGRKED